MTYLRTALLFLSFLLLGSCFGPPSDPVVVDGRSGIDYDAKAANDKNRDDVIKRTAGTIRGDTEKCEDKDKSHDCYEYCDKMFKRRFEDDCEELTVAQVEAIWKLHNLLKEPKSDELEDINLEHLDLYLNVSIEALDDLIDEYSSRDAKEFLIWLINNEGAAEIFRNEDEDHKSLEGLLKEFAGSYTSSGSDISKPFLKRLDRDKLIEEALESEFMLSWFQEYINDKNSACKSDTETRACFAVYCKIGEGMDDDAREDWLDSEDFESYIEDIIDEKVNSRQGTGNNRNASGWIHEDAAGDDNDEIEDVGDLEDWVDDLCQGLTDGASGGAGSQPQAITTWPTICDQDSERTNDDACVRAIEAELDSENTPERIKNAWLWIISDNERIKSTFFYASGPNAGSLESQRFTKFLAKIRDNAVGTTSIAQTKNWYNFDFDAGATLFEVSINRGGSKIFEAFSIYIFADGIDRYHKCGSTSVANNNGANVYCFQDLVCGVAKAFKNKQTTGGAWLTKDTAFEGKLNKLLTKVKGISPRPAYVKATLTSGTAIDNNWITNFCKD